MFAEHLQRPDNGCRHRHCIMHFYSGNSYMCGKPCSAHCCTIVNPQNEDHLKKGIANLWWL